LRPGSAPWRGRGSVPSLRTTFLRVVSRRRHRTGLLKAASPIATQVRFRHTSQPCGNVPSCVAADPGACGLRCSRSRRRRCCPSFTHRSPARPLPASGFRSARRWAWCGSMPATRRPVEATLATIGIARCAQLPHRCLPAPRRGSRSWCHAQSPSAAPWARRRELHRPEPYRLLLAAHPSCPDLRLNARTRRRAASGSRVRSSAPYAFQLSRKPR